MAFVSYEIPPEFKDEERWFKFFSWKSLKVMVITGTVGIVVFRIFYTFGSPILGAIIGGIPCVVCTILSVLPVAETEYMKGAGNTMGELILKKHFRKKRRCILIKHYDNEIQELLKREKNKKAEDERIKKQNEKAARKAEKKKSKRGGYR